MVKPQLRIKGIILVLIGAMLWGVSETVNNNINTAVMLWKYY